MPFSRAQFLAVFEAYNEAVWPAQALFYALAIVGLAAVAGRARFARGLALTILAVLWLWMGVVYHWGFFAEINPAAWVFGAAFVLEGVLLSRHALGRTAISRAAPRWSVGLAVVLALYALALYPLLGQLSDHAWPRSPTFGLPCPTVIYTFALLLALPGRVPRPLLVIPVLWAVVGSTAPFAFGIWEDLGLPIAAAIGVVGVTVRRIADLDRFRAPE